MAANVDAMNEAALEVFRAGHLPVTGEALALPLIDISGEFDAIFTHRPGAVDRCDAAADRRPVGGGGRHGGARPGGRRRGRAQRRRAAVDDVKQERHGGSWTCSSPRAG